MKDSGFFFFPIRSTAVINDGQRSRRQSMLTWRWRTKADVSVTSLRLTWHGRWDRTRAWGVWELVAALVGACEHVAGEPETSDGAWGRVRGRIWPIMVAMDRSWWDLSNGVVRESNSDSEMRIPRKANKARGFAISGKRPRTRSSGGTPDFA